MIDQLYSLPVRLNNDFYSGATASIQSLEYSVLGDCMVEDVVPQVILQCIFVSLYIEIIGAGRKILY